MELLENGLDSLSKSMKIFNQLQSFEGEDIYEFMLKDIVIELHHSIETIFKSLIAKKNEYLIYSNAEEIFKIVTWNKFKDSKKSIQIKTIEFLDALHRVVVLYKLEMSQSDYNRFFMLNETRNALTHYQTNLKDKIIEHNISLLLPFLFNLFEKEIN